MVKLTAYDYSIYGGLKGKLERISADTLVDETQRNESYYKIIVRTKKNNLGLALPIMPGMIASIDILTGERTVLAYLLKLLAKTWERALHER